MSEERPTSDAAQEEAADEARAARPADPDAWATACEEDLEAEKARRRAQYGPPPGSAAEELRKLVDAVTDKLSALQSPLFGAAASGAAQQVVNQVVRQARAAVEPVIERNPQVFDHLAAAGSELLAAYRSAVENQERRWTQGGTARDEDRDRRRDGGRDGDDDPGPGERIDVD
ncbi:DUF5304 domain-containing protein [Streptomyces poonensis]|uniref:DUF5304 domain-containing protein n=1 Tax=Streptomyces poonensis TaxID=68255 RepID=A0A918PHZ1_9ACTN|nr:DUF5304 domain-containing protein [Streptomyces poonensis]GGZ09631.1 hypothetical protein GCM10010365_30900 [Streptomyces poonensis]GLJ88400.1 hypothetical protein GCM10017589_10000 [Streptomyces poonensis]